MSVRAWYLVGILCAIYQKALLFCKQMLISQIWPYIDRLNVLSNPNPNPNPNPYTDRLNVLS